MRPAIGAAVAAAMVRAVLAPGECFGIPVQAEGIKTKAQAMVEHLFRA